MVKLVLKEVCVSFVGVEDFIDSKIEEICFHKKLSVSEVIYFLFMHLCGSFHGAASFVEHFHLLIKSFIK